MDRLIFFTDKFFRVLQSAQDIDCIISIPALKASVTPIAITLIGFLLNRPTALINEANNKPAAKEAGAMTQGISFVNITIESIFNFNLRRQKSSHVSLIFFSKREIICEHIFICLNK